MIKYVFTESNTTRGPLTLEEIILVYVLNNLMKSPLDNG